MIRITAIVENDTPPGLVAEHGLALLIQAYGQRILLDTGAGDALAPNAARLGIDLAGLTHVFLSHGHYDHTGGLAALPPSAAPVFAGPGIDAPCYSRQPDGGMHRISLPEDARKALDRSDLRIVTGFAEIAAGVFSTGPIDRPFPADNGKVFHSDPEGAIVDPIPEEQSLLLKDGVLITGCCHAGIVNTVECCRRNRPDIPLKTLVGGLHLLHADPGQLERAARYLDSLGLERVILLHCTGAAAKKHLHANLACETLSGRCGDSWDL